MSLWIVSRETSERLTVFETLLLKWNARINLIGPREAQELRRRHVEPSLHLLSLLPIAGHVVDLGSGGGLPGIVIAIAGNRDITLVEADARKASFLREAARATGANVEIINDRIEKCGVRNAPIITARALASMTKLLDLSFPLLAPDGVCFFPKGQNVNAELTEARGKWQMFVKRHSSNPTAAGCILEVRHPQPFSTRCRS